MKQALGLLAFFAAIVCAFILGCRYDMKEANKKYNNGICPKCGTEFHLVSVTHMKNNGNYYYYACENDHVIECQCLPSKEN